MNPKRIVIPAYVENIQPILPNYFPALRAAVYEESNLVVASDEPARKKFVIRVSRNAYRRILASLVESNFLVVSYGNGDSDQCLAYWPSYGEYRPNWRLINRVVQDSLTYTDRPRPVEEVIRALRE